MSCRAHIVVRSIIENLIDLGTHLAILDLLQYRACYLVDSTCLALVRWWQRCGVLLDGKGKGMSMGQTL